MDSELIVKLIKLVEKHDILYNKKYLGRLTKHKNVQNAWAKIKNDLNVPGIDPRKEWSKIRQKFYDAAKKRVTGKNKTNLPYKYEKELHFLLPYFKFPKKYRNQEISNNQKVASSNNCEENEIVKKCKNKTEQYSCIHENNFQHHITDNSVQLSKNSLSVVHAINELGLYYNPDAASEFNNLNNLTNQLINNLEIQNQRGPIYFQLDVIEPEYAYYPTQLSTTNSCNKSDVSESHYSANTLRIFDSIDSQHLPGAEEPSYASHSHQWNTCMPSATHHANLTYLPEINNQTFSTINPSYTETNTLPYSTQLNEEIISAKLPIDKEYNDLTYLHEINSQTISPLEPESTESNVLPHSARLTNEISTTLPTATGNNAITYSPKINNQMVSKFIPSSTRPNTSSYTAQENNYMISTMLPIAKEHSSEFALEINSQMTLPFTQAYINNNTLAHTPQANKMASTMLPVAIEHNRLNNSRELYKQTVSSFIPACTEPNTLSHSTQDKCEKISTEMPMEYSVTYLPEINIQMDSPFIPISTKPNTMSYSTQVNNKMISGTLTTTTENNPLVYSPETKNQSVIPILPAFTEDNTAW